jgi:hypothetical protein
LDLFLQKIGKVYHGITTKARAGQKIYGLENARNTLAKSGAKCYNKLFIP